MKHLCCADYTISRPTCIWQESTVFKTPPKATAAERWITELSCRPNELKAIGPPTAKTRWPNVFRRNRGTVRTSVSTGRYQMMSTDDIGHWDAVVDQVFRRSILKAPVNCQNAASLCCTRSGTLSQCNLSRSRRDRHWLNLCVPETWRAVAFNTRWSVSAG